MRTKKKRILFLLVLVAPFLLAAGTSLIMIFDDCYLVSSEEFVSKISSQVNGAGRIYSKFVLSVCRADLSGKTESGVPYLYIVLSGFSYDNKYKVELAEELIRRGQSVNAKDIYGFTLLHKAVLDENVDAVKFLLNHGARINEVGVFKFGNDESKGQLYLTALELARYLVKKKNFVSVEKMKVIETLLDQWGQTRLIYDSRQYSPAWQGK